MIIASAFYSQFVQMFITRANFIVEKETFGLNMSEIR